MSQSNGRATRGNLGVLHRRSFLRLAAALCARHALPAGAQTPHVPYDALALKQAAHSSGKILSVFTGMHEVLYETDTSAMIANTFSMVADGNDLKFSNRLRPTPSTFDFTCGDAVVSWAQTHKLRFRGHCLIWWNALPSWFRDYVTAANAQQVLTNHITTVVRRYAGKVYSWDVVNEPLYPDHRPDGLRIKPWVQLIGPEYIDLAFHTAAAADPKALLILNECYIEHATPNETQWRKSFLALLTRLKKANVPLHGVGIQGHLRGSVPLDKPGLTRFCESVRDLGLEIMITELDVDDVGVPGRDIEQTVARKYGEFLELMAPFVKVITFEHLNNTNSTADRPDGFAHMPNIFGTDYKPTLAYKAVVEALRRN